MWIPRLRSDRRKYEALVEELGKAIETGVLKPNDLLPPQRELAYALGINLSTVTRAYTEATRLGMIRGEVGRGTYVLSDSREVSIFLETARKREEIDLATIGGRIDRLNGSGAAAGAFAESISGLLAYGSQDLSRRAEDAVRQWCAWRGHALGTDTIVLCAGAHAGLDAALRVLTKPKQAVLCEEHTFPGLKAVARFCDIRLVPVMCDSGGAIAESLLHQARATGARLFVTVPNMQNPTGSTMSRERRAEICKVVESAGITVIEDDVYGALCDEPTLISGLSGQHIYLSSLSKSVAPGLKFGFLAGKQEALERLSQEVTLTSWLTSPLLQTLAADVIESGAAQEQTMRNRRVLRERALIVERIFGCSPRTPAPYLWLKTPCDPDHFVDLAVANGVRVISSSAFKVTRMAHCHVRASLFGNADDEEIARGLTVLRQLGASIGQSASVLRNAIVIRDEGLAAEAS
ncbi:PLP-dependent aminotransferase family protein [Rhizobium sp. PP-F2F-G48]|uniref:aminotransferase-like domain-containing protein n=1 Tax=Rhizobium sp. PP-F2F-G48 TaxID=2135651 RepID=UPI001A9ED7CC|nr:PLP-dependent aminotransferase family protein [Rhizobium sp. PP-F2F-G48]